MSREFKQIKQDTILLNNTIQKPLNLTSLTEDQNYQKLDVNRTE